MLNLITGGSGSGKSEYAESLAVAAHKKSPEGKLYYIATMYPYDEECVKRIEKHRKMRSRKGFTTIECYTHLEKVKVTGKDVVLLECMSNLLANEMYRKEGRLRADVFSVRSDSPSGQTDSLHDEQLHKLYEAILTPLFHLAQQAAHMVVVTNEVFSDGTEYEEETGRYLRLLGKINCETAGKAGGVTEVVCGIPVRRKGEAEC